MPKHDSLPHRWWLTQLPNIIYNVLLPTTLKRLCGPGAGIVFTALLIGQRVG
jgi:hypothetical protein